MAQCQVVCAIFGLSFVPALCLCSKKRSQHRSHNVSLRQLLDARPLKNGRPSTRARLNSSLLLTLLCPYPTSPVAAPASHPGPHRPTPSSSHSHLPNHQSTESRAHQRAQQPADPQSPSTYLTAFSCPPKHGPYSCSQNQMTKGGYVKEELARIFESLEINFR